MRKLILFFLASFLLLSMNAQTFSKAPIDSKPIKQIIEWTTFPANKNEFEETIKDVVYSFLLDGQLEKWESNNSDNEVYHYEYDGKNRLIKVTIQNEEWTRTMTYQYFEDRRMAEIQERVSDVRTIQYFNKKGQIVEEKSFWKGELSEGQWTTLERTVFNYNGQDSLYGEMRYETTSSGKVNQYKTVHQYNDLPMKKNITYYDADGKSFKLVLFNYDKEGRLIKEETKMTKTGENSIIENVYREGKLWQSIKKGKNYRNEKIYKDGRLIRSKEYNQSGNLIWHTDYQYVFY